VEDDEAHSPPVMELFQLVAELARKAVQNVDGVNEEQLQKEDEVVEEEIVQDKVVIQIEDYTSKGSYDCRRRHLEE